MPEHRDAEMAEVVVVLDTSCEGKVPQTLQQLQQAGLEVVTSDEENLTVEGTIDASKLPALKQVQSVQHVRVSMSYIADFPPGDPRDDDGVEEDDE